MTCGEAYADMLIEEIGRYADALEDACKFVADNRGDCPGGVFGTEYFVCSDCTSDLAGCWRSYFLDSLTEVG